MGKKSNERVAAEGLAINNPHKVHNISNECMAETDTVREDLSSWLPEDEDDVTLPSYWLHPQVRHNAEEDEALEAADRKSRNGPGLLQVMKHFSSRDVGTGHKAASDIMDGGTLQLLADEDLVLRACREAGITPAYDQLRKQAIGR